MCNTSMKAVGKTNIQNKKQLAHTCNKIGSIHFVHLFNTSILMHSLKLVNLIT